MSAPVLEVEDLRVRLRTPRGTAHVVNGLSYTVEPGQTVAVVGESGSGKSVSVLALLGLLPQRVATVEGRATFDGKDLLSLSEDGLRRVRGAGIGMVFQDPMTSLNPVLTVGRQIVEGIRAHRDVSKEAARTRAADLLGEVGLPDPRKALDRYPHELSGGMRQRVMIAIALSCEPALLVADEATTALDVTVQAQILELVAKLQSEHGTGVVWITHDLGVVAGIADRVLVMYGGRCVEDGDVDDVYERPAHPYTRGLLGALPDLEEDVAADGAGAGAGGAGAGAGDGTDGAGRGSRELVTIPGSPPSPTDLPPGCVFWPRCPVRADSRCESEEPPLVPVASLRRDRARAPGDASGTGDAGGGGRAAVTHRAATFCPPDVPLPEPGEQPAGGQAADQQPADGQPTERQPSPGAPHE